jgi:predicted protein tyrosine phosphatase
MKLKVLFVCSQNRLRSPTAEFIFMDHPGIECKSVGTDTSANLVLKQEHIDWADIVIAMEKSHRNRIWKLLPSSKKSSNIIVLGIEDVYEYKDPFLIRLIEQKVTPFLEMWKIRTVNSKT